MQKERILIEQELGQLENTFEILKDNANITDLRGNFRFFRYLDGMQER